MAILDLSKLHMYRFYYDVLKPMYGEKIKLVYTDTDSFVIHIETDDLYEDLKQISDYMDFSDYPKDHPNYDTTNKKVLGKFKDDMHGNIIAEFIALKPKMYAFKVEDGKEQKKQKEYQKKRSNKIWTSNCIKKTLEENHVSKVEFNSIRSYGHQIYSITCSKTGLSNYENKRYYVSNYESYPHGHYSITNQSISSSSCL